jgi:hypothetical protein
MKISGFTIARNAIKYNYPILESIQSILPICDEFIVNVGDSEDKTLELIQSIKSPKIRIVQNTWDFSQGPEVLSYQTNLALKECTGDWAFYLQSDEVVHEADLPTLKRHMEKSLENKDVDAIRFRWFHFYGSYARYRIDRGWYQKQDRIIRNNGTVESCGDAFGFRRKDGKDLRSLFTNCFIYHYGWVQPDEVMASRRKNAEKIGFVSLQENERQELYNYANLNQFPIYFGTHPKVMRERIQAHQRSQQDFQDIQRQHWWNPLQLLHIRLKTGLRVRQKIES